MPLALITGASTGIGRATALALAGAGWNVLAGIRDAEAGERLRQAASGPGGVEPIVLDVTDAAQVAAAATRVGERLDGLVNNAGIAVGGPLELVPIDELRRQFEVNVFGQIAVTQALLPALRRAQGRIVLVSSIGGRVPTPFTAPYAASKHALEAFGDALRVELRTSGVQVALIEPGSVATPIWEKGRESTQTVSIPDGLQREYGHVPEAIGRALHETEARGVPPELVARTILSALTAGRPRTRYLVGRDARAMLAIRRLLPDRAFDALIRRALHV